MFILSDYAKIKDNYCISYYGHSDEYLIQLRLLKNLIQNKFNGINLYFGCKDEKIHLLGNQPVMKSTEIKAKRKDFAQIKTIEFNGETHPIEDLLIESGIINFEINVPEILEHSDKMMITTHGNYPTTPLTQKQINLLKKIGNKAGYSVEVNTDWRDAGWVAGVESVGLFEAAGSGIKTTLVNTGIGKRLYKFMFPQGEIIEL